VRVALGQYELNDPGRLRGLLIEMARRKLAEAARSQQRARRDVRRVEGSPIEDGEIAAPVPDPAQVVEARELLQQVQARLTEEEWMLTTLRSQGHDWAAIANTVGGTSDSRRKQHTRALNRVAKELGLAEDDSH
jgi:DNA-directed RNA polymerase specialized sigma24 family protein